MTQESVRGDRPHSEGFDLAPAAVLPGAAGAKTAPEGDYGPTLTVIGGLLRSVWKTTQ